MMNPFKNRKGLGRGLSSLIGDNEIKTEKNYDGTINGIVSIIKNFESSFGNVESIGIGMPGAISADTAFIEKNIKKYDVFLAMYHDQGLPVIKSMGFGNTLNVTLGLPFIRISVDHGTAYEIAGKNEADFSSMEEALKTSVSLL